MNELILVKHDNSIADAILFVLANDMRKISKNLITKDIPCSVKNSVAGLSNTGSYVKDLYSTGRDKGIKASGLKISNNIYDLAVKVKKAPRAIYTGSKQGVKVLKAHLNSLEDREKADFIFKLACYTTSFAGGAYLGNAIPDKDFKIFGPGRHRDFMLHSVFASLAITTLARFLWRIFDESEKYLPSNSDEIKKLSFLKTNTQFLAFGGYAGVAAHLAIDGTIQGTKSVTTPISGTFISGTILDDNAYLVFNSILAAFAGVEEIQKKAN